ncbi:MAG: lysophospholipid acyltransferase family protein [Pseudomonadota bacterium]
MPIFLALPYAAYAVVVFTVLALLALLIVLLLPGLAARRGLVRIAARLFLFLVGMRLRVVNPEYLPAGPCVVVANHASYLDGIVMKAVLPARFGFVIKREMNDVPLAGLLLRRIGAEFVDRGKGQRGARDARRVLKAASTGSSLVFFPEGTFSPQPGLLRFHAGAFVSAARANFPVAPVVIRGTRKALPPARPVPSPGVIEVILLPPISAAPGASPDEAVADLKGRARTMILTRLGEPDLQ